MYHYKQGRQTSNTHNKVTVSVYAILLALLFLMSLNFLGRFFYVAFFAAAFLFFVQPNAIRLPCAIIPVLLLSVSMCIFATSASYSILAILKQYTYPLCVLIGYNLIYSNDVSTAEKQSTTLTTVLALGAYGHYLLNLLLNRGVVAERNMYDFWTRSVLSATGQAALACMIVAVATALLFMSTRKLVKFSMVAILASVLYYNLMLAGRTIFVLFAVAIAVSFVARIIVDQNPSHRLKLIASMVGIILIVIVLFATNSFGIRDTMMESNFYDRFFGDYAQGINEDGRMNAKLKYLALMSEYPLGGGEIHKIVGGYAHDIFLDTYDEGGFFALLAVVLFLMDMVMKCIKIFRRKKVSGDFKILTATFVVVVMLEFMVEPILAGVPWLLASFCIIYGAYSRLVELY